MNPLKILNEKLDPTLKSEEFKDLDLNQLREDIKAMFTTFALFPAAEKLQNLETLQGDKEAVILIDTLIVRANAVRTKPGQAYDAVQRHLPLMAMMLPNLCLDTFTKVEEVSQRLTRAGLEPAKVEQYSNMVEQPEAHADACLFLMSAATSAESCCLAQSRYHSGYTRI